MEMEIFVILEGGVELSMIVCKTCNLETLKHYVIVERPNVNRTRTKFVFKGEVLINELKTVEEYGIKNGDKVVLWDPYETCGPLDQSAKSRSPKDDAVSEGASGSSVIDVFTESFQTVTPTPSTSAGIGKKMAASTGNGKMTSSSSGIGSTQMMPAEPGMMETFRTMMGIHDVQGRFSVEGAEQFCKYYLERSDDDKVAEFTRTFPGLMDVLICGDFESFLEYNEGYLTKLQAFFEKKFDEAQDVLETEPQFMEKMINQLDEQDFEYQMQICLQQSLDNLRLMTEIAEKEGRTVEIPVGAEAAGPTLPPELEPRKVTEGDFQRGGRRVRSRGPGARGFNSLPKPEPMVPRDLEEQLGLHPGLWAEEERKKEAMIKEHEAQLKEYESKKLEQEAKLKEYEAKLKELDAKIKEMEAKNREREERRRAKKIPPALKRTPDGKY